MALSLVASVVLVGAATWLVRQMLRRAIPAPVFAMLAAALSLGMWYLLGFGVQAVSLMRVATIPIVAMTILSTGEMLVITRASMTDTREEQYVMTARAKGLSETKVRDDHAAPNAILPILTRAGIGLPYLLGGLAIIESTLKWPGVGSALFNAAVIQDIPLVLGVMLFIGIVTLFLRLGLDVAYVLLEPRLRAQAGQH
jgi:peptide/nickel transport system permease protein